MGEAPLRAEEDSSAEAGKSHTENHKASLELQKAGFLQEIDRQEADCNRIEDVKDERIAELEEQLRGFRSRKSLSSTPR